MFVFLFVLLLLLPAGSLFASDTSGFFMNNKNAFVCASCHKIDGMLSGEIMKLAETKNTSQRCAECHNPVEADPVADTGRRRKWKYKKWDGTAYKIKPIEQEMVLVPSGKSYIGNNGRVNPVEGRGNNDETPLHTVYTDAFFMDKYETTNYHYRSFVDATGHRVPKSWKNGFPDDKLNHPVVFVDWADADAFCRWSGKRLPAESEWEKGARGTDTRSFPWGGVFNVKYANTPQYWFIKKHKGSTMNVGSFPEGASVFGLMDMSGNVYEWVEDWYLPYPGNRYPNQHYGKKNKILRGGSWYDCLAYGCGMSAPVYNRARVTPKLKNKSTGFRCAGSVGNKGDNNRAPNKAP